MRRLGVGLALVIAAVAVLISPALGRAVPSGAYRPELPPDTIQLGCYPLPPGLTLDFPYQVRSDGDRRGQRVLTLQWDQLDPSDVRQRLDAALDRAGLPRSAARVTPYDGRAIVRGAIVLHLPVARLASTASACRDPETTKRFPPDWAPSTDY